MKTMRKSSVLLMVVYFNDCIKQRLEAELLFLCIFSNTIVLQCVQKFRVGSLLGKMQIPYRFHINYKKKCF